MRKYSRSENDRDAYGDRRRGWGHVGDKGRKGPTSTGPASRGRQRRSRGSPRVGSRCLRGRRCTSRRRSVEAASGRVPEALALQPFNLSIMLPGDGRENRLVSSLVTGDKNLQSQPPRKQSLQPHLRVGEEVQLQPLCDSRGDGGEEPALLTARVCAARWLQRRAKRLVDQPRETSEKFFEVGNIIFDSIPLFSMVNPRHN